jgi:uncharacterized protein YuzE
MKMHYDEQVDALYLSIEVLDVKRRVPSADLKQLEFEVASASGS